MESLQVTGAPTRCPFCHDGIEPDQEAWAVCKACLARHHASCWREGGARCAGCAGTKAFVEGRGAEEGEEGEEPRVAPQSLLMMLAFPVGAGLGGACLFLLILIEGILRSALGGWLS